MREGGDPSAWPYGPEPNSRDPSEDGSRYGDEPTGKDPRVETEQMQKEKDQKSGNENENAGEECNSRESSTTGRDNNEEYLRNMGDTVADMLDPLGENTIHIIILLQNAPKCHIPAAHQCLIYYSLLHNLSPVLIATYYAVMGKSRPSIKPYCIATLVRDCNYWST